MALTELQLPLKAQFYQNIQHAATEINNLMHRWAELSEFIAKIETADLDAMGVPAGQVRTDLVQFRTALENIVDCYKGEAVTPATAPEVVMDKIRRM